MLHCHVRFISAAATAHAEKLSATGPVRSQSHERVHAWQAETINQLVELRGGVAAYHATASIDQRSARSGQQQQCPADLSRMSGFNGRIGAHCDAARAIVDSELLR